MTDRADNLATKIVGACAHAALPDVGEERGACMACVAAVLRAYAEEAVLVWRADLWLAHSHSGALYDYDGEMQCTPCMVDYKRAGSSQVVAAALHARAAEVRLEERTIADRHADMRYDDGHAGGSVDERKACARMGDQRAQAMEEQRLMHTQNGVESAEGSWYRARKVEATDYAAAIRART